MTIHLDFETRGSVNLLKAGATRYAVDDLTQVLCMCWAFNDGPVHTWHRAHHFEGQSPFPTELVQWIEAGELVEAHNAGFEWNVWNKTLRREFPEFPELPLGQMRCSAAKASCMSLPRALDDAAAALDLRDANGDPIRKDPRGRMLIQKLAKPQPIRRGQVKTITFSEDPDLHRENWLYCAQDVVVERALSDALPPMTDRELEYWKMDQRMNERGITLDVKAADTALNLASAETERLNRELTFITNGGVDKGSRRKMLQQWVNGELQAMGVAGLANTRADTLSFALHGVPTKASDEAFEAAAPEAAAKWEALGDQGDEVKRVLNICMEVNKTSTAKFKQMIDSVCPDGRLHDIMLYNGADRTGRWSGKGVQPHNFPRGYSKQMEAVWDDILDEPADVLATLWEEPLIVLAKSCRGALTASAGKELYAADFNAIEARMLVWMANSKSMLQLFLTGGDPYIAMAEAIYKRSLNKRDNPNERQMGKRAVLGLGYAMGWEKFQSTVYGEEGVWLEDKFCQDVVNVYRKEMCPEVPQFWRDVNKAAINTVKDDFGGEYYAGGAGTKFLTVELTPDDIAWATRIAHARKLDTPNTRGLEGRGLCEDLIGAAAELAFCRALGLEWTPEAKLGTGKSSADVDPYFEVKSSVRGLSSNLLLGATDGYRKNVNDVCVDVVPAEPYYDDSKPMPTRYLIRGWWDNTKPRDPTWVRDPHGRSPAHFIPAHALNTDFSKWSTERAKGKPATAGAGAISYFVSGRFLHCRLPSGRLLAYLDPKVSQRTSHKFSAVNARGNDCTLMFPSKPGLDPWKVRVHAEKLAEKVGKRLKPDTPETFTQDHLSFMGRHILTKKWVRVGTHGGSLVENADQAASRDLLAEAMLRVDQDDRFDLLLSIHDEVVAEAPVGTCDVGEFERMMSVVPQWAPGMPITAEGWKAQRLRK